MASWKGDHRRFFAHAQDDAAETWERAYMRKALKEYERRKAAHIYTEVQISLGNRERMCRYHKTADGNNHKDIHCMYNPCYLHAWKYYEISDESDGTVTKIPGNTVHFNGECYYPNNENMLNN